MQKLFCAIVALAIQVAPGHAACIAGYGTSCPIDDAAAGALIVEALVADRDGYYTLGRSIDAVHGSPRASPPYLSVDMARPEGFRRISFIAGNEDCDKYDRSELTKMALAIPVKIAECRKSRVLHRRGLATFIAMEGKEPYGRVNFYIWMKLTPTGEALAKAAKQSPLVGTPEDTVAVATHTKKSVRVVRSRLNDAGSEKMFEFEYELVPNVWAHVEKMMLTDGLPSVKKSGVALFVEMSDGWKLTHMRME